MNSPLCFVVGVFPETTFMGNVRQHLGGSVIKNIGVLIGKEVGKHTKARRGLTSARSKALHAKKTL